MQRQQQQVDHLNVFTKKQSLVKVAAEAVAMPEVPQVLFIHRRITVGHHQLGIQAGILPERHGLPEQRSKHDDGELPCAPEALWDGLCCLCIRCLRGCNGCEGVIGSGQQTVQEQGEHCAETQGDGGHQQAEQNSGRLEG